MIRTLFRRSVYIAAIAFIIIAAAGILGPATFNFNDAVLSQMGFIVLFLFGLVWLNFIKL